MRLAFYAFPFWWFVLYGLLLRAVDLCFFRDGTHLYQAVPRGTLSACMCLGYIIAFLIAIASNDWFKPGGKGSRLLLLWFLQVSFYLVGTGMTQRAMEMSLDMCAGMSISGHLRP